MVNRVIQPQVSWVTGWALSGAAGRVVSFVHLAISHIVTSRLITVRSVMFYQTQESAGFSPQAFITSPLKNTQIWLVVETKRDVRLAVAIDRLVSENSAESRCRICGTNNAQVVGWCGGSVSRVDRILVIDFRFLDPHRNDLRLRLALLLCHYLLDFNFCPAPIH